MAAFPGRRGKMSGGSGADGHDGDQNQFSILHSGLILMGG
jgi:hypothetical protein